MIVLWVLTPCRFVGGQWLFGGSYLHPSWWWN